MIRWRWPEMPLTRFYVLAPEDGMAMDENGCRISMRGFVPTFEFDQAVEIARKFHGEVA